MDELVRGTIRFEPDFHQRLRIEIARRNLRSTQAAIMQALELWMAGVSEGAPAIDQPVTAPFGHLSRDEQKQVQMLLAVLRSGDKESIQAVKSNLVLFFKHARLLGLVPEETEKNVSGAGDKQRS